MRDAARHAEAQRSGWPMPPIPAPKLAPPSHTTRTCCWRWSASCVVRYRCRIKHFEFCQLIHPEPNPRVCWLIPILCAEAEAEPTCHADESGGSVEAQGGATQHQAGVLLKAGRTRRPRPWDGNFIGTEIPKGPARIGDRIWRRRACLVEAEVRIGLGREWVLPMMVSCSGRDLAGSPQSDERNHGWIRGDGDDVPRRRRRRRWPG